MQLNYTELLFTSDVTVEYFVNGIVFDPECIAHRSEVDFSYALAVAKQTKAIVCSRGLSQILKKINNKLNINVKFMECYILMKRGVVQEEKLEYHSKR